MKKLILILIAVFSLNVAFGQTVIISEVTDPGDVYQAKYVEIYNTTSSTVDLTGWQIRRYANGATTSSDFSLSGTIASGTSITIAYSSSDFNTAYGFNPDFSNGTVISGNGDDVYELTDGTNTIDIYGVIGTDGTGTSWEYTDSIATRNSNICSGNTTWTNTEWTITSPGNVADATPNTHTCDCPLSVDTDSDAIAPTTQVSGVNISSLVDTSAEAIDVFKIEIQDSGLGDTLDTKVTNVRIKPHTTNTADWTDTIQGFVIDDGVNFITPTTINITDTFIDLTFNANDLTIPDNESRIVTLAVYLKTTNIVDGSVLSFMVDAANHGFTADSSGSTFATTFPNGDFNSNDFPIGVVATELQITQQPTNVDVLSIMSPAVTVAYTDINGNVDVDFDGVGVTAALTATGATLAGSTTTDGAPIQGVMTFNDIKFDTTGLGVTLTITDSGNITNTSITSTTFDVTGEQEIELQGANNGFIIVNGNTLPDEDHDTLFGLISTAGATSTQTYTINNLGVLDLILTDPSPYITIGGTDAADFSVSVIPTTPIAGSSSVIFEITFDPSTAGFKQAVINIASNDADESTYSFAIEGTGYDPCSQLFISEYANITGGNYLEIYNPTNAAIDMSNYQIWIGTDGGAWSSATIINLTGTLASGNVHVIAKDPTEILYANTFSSAFIFNGNDNIALAFNDGSGTFNLIDSIGDDQGNPGAGWSVAGTADATLNHTLVRKTTVDYANPNWTNSAGTDAVNSEWGVLTYTPYTQLHHVSDCQQIPLMAVVGHLTGVGNDELVIDEGLAGTQTPKASNNTLFEKQEVGVTTISHTFRIYNPGNTDLNLTGTSPDFVTITGTNSSDFTVTTQPSTPVTANNGFTDFIIEFSPTANGIRTALVSIANNNPFENPYTFTIQGTGFVPCTELFISEYAQVTGGNYLEIYNPSGIDVDMSNYQIWRSAEGGSWATATVISLSGTLAGGNVYVLARDASEITYANQFDASLDFNGDDNIGLAINDGSGTYYLLDAIGNDQGDPGTGWTVAGVADGTINHTLVRKPTVNTGNIDWISSAGTDAVDSEWGVTTYTPITQLHHVSDCQLIPLMAVVGHLPGVGNDELIIDEGLAGTQTPKASNNTLFEDQQVGVTVVNHNFRIYNAGNTDLDLTGATLVDVTGANPSDFIVTQPNSSTVTANGGFVDFSILFNPTDYGVRTAIISIANNNPFENPYTFTVQGTGLNYTACDTQSNITFAFEDFDETAPGWNYTTDIAFFNNNADGFFGIHDGDNDGDANDTGIGSGATNINYANITNDFLYVYDLDDEGVNGTSAFATITFADVDLLSAENVVFSFDYDIIEFDNGDDVKYQLFYDGIGQGEVILMNGNSNLSAEGTVVINIPNEIETFGFALSIKQNGTADFAGFDNFRVFGDSVQVTKWYDNAGILQWSNGVPTRNLKAIIDANYNTANGNIEACACQVNSGTTLTVNAGEHLLIETDFENNGTVEVFNEGSIVQHNKDANITGANKFLIHKTTTSYASYDYIYWSSPLDGETFDNVFNANLQANEGRRIYTFNTANFSDEFDGSYPQTTGSSDTFDDDNNDWSLVDFSTNMNPGKGYIVMGTGSTFPLPSPLTFTNQIQSVAFNKGIINNGDVIVPIVLDAYNVTNGSGNNFNTNANLIGNPYPSAIDITKLASQVYHATNNPTGVLEGTFYFWTHDTNIGAGTNAGPDLYNFTNDDYAVATVDNAGLFSNVAGSNGTVTATSQYISSGQGFFANAQQAGNLTFTNNMRIIDNNNTFKNTTTISDLDRIWLNLTKTDDYIFRQIMVGFHNNATDGYVNGQDGKRSENGTNTDFYSLIPSDNTHYAIQNLGTFNNSKTIDLGLEIIQDGTYEIAIDHVVGIFAEDQIVYLEDKDTNTIWDLTNNGAYQFVATVGEDINNRFVLRFTTTALGISENTISTQLVVAQNSTSFDISTTDETKIKSAELFNTLGQKLGNYKANNGQLQIPTMNINKGTVLFINVALDNGAILSKKLVKL